MFSQLLLTVCADRVAIDTLPDDVLLLIFHFNRVSSFDRLGLPWRWDRLVHVCRRWRSVVFSSPTFLDLKLVCGPWTRVELWPPLPIIIMNKVTPESYELDAAIVHPNRVHEINLHSLTSSQLQRLAPAMQEQFPALIHLFLDSDSDRISPAPTLPDGFVGGSAPRLQSLELRGIPFPALPKLLLSTTDLVRLTLWRIPHSGYASPEAIVTGLAALANLKSLTIELQSPRSRPNRESRRPSAPTRTALPALTHFEFHGVSEYLEDLVARIDAPLLDSICITFFHQLIFDIPQLARFMRRTMARFQAINEPHVSFDDYGVRIESLPPAQASGGESVLRISCGELDWQLSSLSQVFPSFFPSIHTAEHLYIYESRYLPSRQDDVESMQWLEILRPFTALKNLYVSKKFVQYIVPPLQDLVEERVADVLPALESLLLEGLQPSGPVQEAIGKFASARQLQGHPVVVSRWKRS